MKTRKDIRIFCDDMEKNHGVDFDVSEHGLLNCESRAAKVILGCLEDGYSVPEVYYAFIACALEIAPDDAEKFAGEAFGECAFERFRTKEEKAQIALALSADESIKQ